MKEKLSQKQQDRSLFEKIGGRDAVSAAVDLFYDKIITDARINHLFDGTDLKRQRAKQKAFMTYAFGGAPTYSGLSMRKAHEKLVREKDLNEGHFNAVAENLVETLRELGMQQDLIDEIMTLVGSTKQDVLGL